MEQLVTGAVVKDHPVVTEGWRPGSGPIPQIPGLVAAGYGVVTIPARHPGRKRRTGRRSFHVWGTPGRIRTCAHGSGGHVCVPR